MPACQGVFLFFSENFASFSALGRHVAGVPAFFASADGRAEKLPENPVFFIFFSKYPAFRLDIRTFFEYTISVRQLSKTTESAAADAALNLWKQGIEK